MSNLTVKGNTSGTGTVILEAPNTNTNRTITLPDATATLASVGNIITLGTAVASTSGTAIDFTGIPSTAKRVTVMLSGVSLSGTANILIQLGSGSIQTTGYIASTSSTSSTAGFPFQMGSASISTRAAMIIYNVTSTTWLASGTASYSSGGAIASGGNVSLSGALDRIRVTTDNGTDTFDAGTINIMWEG